MAKEFMVTLETPGSVDHVDGDKRKGLRMTRLEAADKDEAKSLAEQSAREERAQIVLAGADEDSVPQYKVKKVEGI